MELAVHPLFDEVEFGIAELWSADRAETGFVDFGRAAEEAGVRFDGGPNVVDPGEIVRQVGAGDSSGVVPVHRAKGTRIGDR